MLINRIKVTSKNIQIGYIQDEAGMTPRSYVLKSVELGRPEFYEAMENIFKVLSRMNGSFAIGCEGTVETVRLKYNGVNQVQQFMLSGRMYGENIMLVTFDTEPIIFEPMQSLSRAVYSVVKEAERYIKGERAQMTLAGFDVVESNVEKIAEPSAMPPLEVPHE